VTSEARRGIEQAKALKSTKAQIYQDYKILIYRRYATEKNDEKTF
jgi:hypothetical protein